MPAFVTKDPTGYGDELVMLMKLDISKEEKQEALSHKYDVEHGVYSEDYPKLFNYDAALFDETLAYLVGRGYSVEESVMLMKTGVWVDEEGHMRTDSELEQSLRDSEFFAEYGMLPNYIKYEKGQYGKLKRYYKSQGVPEHLINLTMMNEKGYVRNDGTYTQLDDNTQATLENNLSAKYYSEKNQSGSFGAVQTSSNVVADGDAVRRTAEALTEAGMSVDEATEAIQNGAYVTLDGALINSSDITSVPRLSVISETGGEDTKQTNVRTRTASENINNLGSGYYGSTKVFQEHVTGTRARTRAAYPATYRNPIRNKRSMDLYHDMYDARGVSRMQNRIMMTRMHDAYGVKLRREEIHYNMQRMRRLY